MERDSERAVFSERLRASMARRGLKQTDMIRAAAELGGRLGKSQVSQYVSGKTVPRRDMVRLLAQILEVDAAWLIGAGVVGATWAHRPVAPSVPEPVSARSA